MVSVSEGDYRLFYRSDGSPPELYDRSTDPREQIDLAKDQPDVLARMNKLAEDYLPRPKAGWSGGDDVILDPVELEQLRALGYQVD